LNKNIVNLKRLVLLAFALLGVVGCQTTAYQSVFGPKQNLSFAKRISSGMSPAEVVRVMENDPVAREFAPRYEEWHYCDSDTWDGSDHKYVAIYFIDGKVASMKPYGVSGQDDADCSIFVKKGNYREPDFIREYRLGGS
jgi:hypothetical protein